MADKPNGHNGNGHGPVTKRFERTAFPAKDVSFDTLIDQIRKLGQSGSLTISFHDGHVAGHATFEREVKEKGQ